MSGISEIVNELLDRTRVVVDIPIKDSESQLLQSVLRKRQAPQLALFFSPHALQVEDIEAGTTCHLTVKHHDSSINLLARIDGLEDDRTLLLTATESVKPEAMREYFRVSISTPITAEYRPGPKEIRNRPWKLEGNTIDLSGGGVLALFSEKPLNRKRIHLTIRLPDQAEPAVCMAEVVRTYRMRKKRYQVAFHFDRIDQKTRDLIISCCLQEQRRQLRNKIRVD
ncbi:MAG TPA: PilZ domain-containing protein [Desulfobulbus sp.]|nr:PilZ domain-containing protein [Desulfobulbus sp.]